MTNRKPGMIEVRAHLLKVTIRPAVLAIAATLPYATVLYRTAAKRAERKMGR
jgi:hypothetical protein